MSPQTTAAAPTGARDKVRSERWYARRDEIVDISAHLFATNGYHATGLTELCDAAGIGRGALYHYIESKENLLALIHDRVMVDVLRRGGAIARQNLPPDEKLACLGRDLVDIITERPDHVSVFLHEFRVLTGERADHFRTSRQQYERMVESVLQEGVDRGDFRIPDVRLAALAWLGLHNYIYLWFTRQRTYTSGQVADSFASIYLAGVLTTMHTKSRRKR